MCNIQEASWGTMMLIVLSLITALCGLSINPSGTGRICASRKKDIKNIALKQNLDGADYESVSEYENHIRIERDNDIKFENCNNFCYALWQEEKTTNGSEIIILLQGCWKQSGEQKCENTECIALQQSTKALNNTKFCCCRGDYCNLNITDYSQNRLLQSSPETIEYLEQTDLERWMLIIIITLACTVLILFTITMLVYRIYRNNIMIRLGKPKPYSDQFSESTALRTGTYTVDHLKLTTIVGQGRYGSVWQGSMGDQDVAVKIYPSHYGNYFQNEKDTYCLPFMEHTSLLNYYGADERVNLDGSIEYLLVLSYAPGGTLTDFLRSNTIDWLSFCKMGLSIVKGLAHLHTDISKGDKLKPCIAHRDINSRNILIKADGTCCICDLGLAVQISGSKYYSNGEEQRAETKSINDVGTLRYMAPEILEGAVNLRDCESSLKQIDVYAIGLVLWELVSRCSDIYVPGTEVPLYKQPFESEIGLHPTFEQMQVLVSRNKVRPVLEGNLVDKQGVRLIKETMEDCWDSDAEARLTALCIEERLTELQSHRVTMHFIDGSPIMNSHCGLVPSTMNSLYNDTPSHDNVHIMQFAHQSTQDAQINESVLENLVNLSPSDSAHEHSFKNSNEMATCAQTLQPYQGRNPCLERNLMTQSDSCEDLACDGNILVDRSSKHTSNEQQYKLLPESQSLMTHDYLNQHAQQLRPATPIPYVQNVISENSAAGYHKHKQTNVHDFLSQESPPKKKFTGWSHLKKMLANKKTYSYSKCQIDRDDSKSNLLAKTRAVDTNVTIAAGGKYVNGIVGKSSGEKNANCCRNESERPSTLPLIPLKNRKSDNNMRRQESLDKFNEVFNVGSNLGSLKDPNMRVKTPGDLPPSVRKVRGRTQSTARFSLYDDRIMCNIFSEEDDNGGKSISTSVPFGMDYADKASPNIEANNVTCF